MQPDEPVKETFDWLRPAQALLTGPGLGWRRIQGLGVTQHRFLALDGLRGIAALAVFTVHPADHTLATLLPGSYLAVDLFFLLSGFVIAHAYGDRLGRDMGVPQFVLARYVRLAPMHLLGAAIGFAVLAWLALDAGRNIAPLAGAAASSLAFLPATPFVPEQALFPLNYPAWSLFFEIVANTAFALILVFAPRLKLWPLIALAGACLVAAALSYGSLDAGVRYDGFLLALARVVFSFFVGVALFRLWKRKPMSVGVPAPMLALAMVAVFAIPATGFRSAFDLAAVTIIFPALIFLGASSQPKALAGACTTLGAASYPFYAIHVPMLLLLDACIAATGLAPSLATFGVAGVLGAAVLIFGAALMLDRVYDQPVRRQINRLLAGRRSRETQDLSAS